MLCTFVVPLMTLVLPASSLPWFGLCLEPLQQQLSMFGCVIFVFCRKSPLLDGRNLSSSCTSFSTSSSSSSWTQIFSSFAAVQQWGTELAHYTSSCSQQPHILLIQRFHTDFLEHLHFHAEISWVQSLHPCTFASPPLLLLLPLLSVSYLWGNAAQGGI